MKKISLITFCILSFTNFVNSQISIINSNDISKKEEIITPSSIIITQYDSLKPIEIDENDTIQYRKFIGQKIYILKSNNPVKMYSYNFNEINCKNMSYRPDFGGESDIKIWTNIYKPENKCYKEEYTDWKNSSRDYNNTRYGIKSSNLDSVTNRYYRIIDIINYNSNSNYYADLATKVDQRISQNSRLNTNNKISDIKKTGSFVYLLVNDLNKDTILYEPSSFRFPHTSDYISVGFYEKIRQIYEGKNMVWFMGSKSYRNVQYPETFEDNQNIIFDEINSRSYNRKESGMYFKCSAIKLSNRNEILAIFQNEKDTISVLCPKDLDNREYITDLFGIDYYNSDFTSYISQKLKHTNISKFLLEDDVKIIENDKKYIMFKNGQLIKKEFDPAEERLKECIKLYGQKNGSLIANYTISLGMNRAMCESAGFTIISTMTTKEGKVQVYGNRFEKAVLVNGIVTKIYK